VTGSVRANAVYARSCRIGRHAGRRLNRRNTVVAGRISVKCWAPLIQAGPAALDRNDRDMVGMDAFFDRLIRVPERCLSPMGCLIGRAIARGAGLLLVSMTLVCLAIENPPALAGETAQQADSQLVAYDMRVAGDEVRTRIVIEFERKPTFSYHLPGAPHRLVVDLPQTLFGFDDSMTQARGLLSDIRFGLMAPGRSRMVFSAIGPIKAEMAEVIENGPGGGYRLVFDLVATSERDFAAQMRSQEWEAFEPADDDPVPVPSAVGDKPFTVVVDPGHGGIDAGARGQKGLDEKVITLLMAETLKAALKKYPDIHVVLTRSDDRFVSLGERVRIARQHEADLLISLHADSIRLRRIRGATVYTLSDKASDQMAQQLAARENRSDLIAGLSLEEEPDAVADILVDLTRRETQMFSIGMARAVIDSFDGSIRLINNPIRSAGFRVLRAHDVPSVLVEMGYLSNVEDEKLLRDAQWREKAADLLASAIDAFRRKTRIVED